jgi:hypothetical protein
MPKTGRIAATWAEGVRNELEDFVANSHSPGAVLVLFKTADQATATRWSYAAFGADLIQSLDAPMAARGHPLLYALDGMTVAITNVNHVRELDGMVLTLEGPGVLLARSARITTT